MDDQEKLAQEFTGLISEYYSRSAKPAKFIPGETVIPSSGKMIGIEEIKNGVLAVLEGWLTEGHWTDAFEKAMAGFLGVRYGSLCNSGSSANMLALSALTSPLLKEARLRPGDEVITTAAGFPTTINPIIWNRLVPVFIDVKIGTYVPTIEQIEEAIGPKTKAVMLAHTLGNPWPIHKMKDHSLWLIEDNCDALGSRLADKFTGTWGHVATQSFYPAHHITTGEGGMVMTSNPRIHKAVESFRDWGRDCAAAGEPIFTKGGVKPIENVIVNDLVFNQNGYFDRVIALTGRASRPLKKVKVTLRPEVVVSEGHPFLVWDGRSTEWRRADTLSAGDYLMEKVPLSTDCPPVLTFEYETEYGLKEFSIKNDLRLARIMGYYAAEGSLATGSKGLSGYKKRYSFYRTDFTFNSKRKSEVDDLIGLMRTVFGCGAYIREGENSISLSFKSRKAFEVLSHLVGRGAKNKNLPVWIIHQSKPYLIEFIKSYWAGDGHIGKKSLSCHSISHTLHEQTRLILLRLGVVASSWKRTPDKHKTARVNGSEIIARSDLYALSIYGQSANIFAKHLGIPPQYPNGANKAKIENGYCYYPVERIENAGTGMVYNIEVENEHTYHLAGLISHNCWCEPGKENTCGKRFDHDWDHLPHGYDHKYVYSHLGFNFKSTDIQAAIGLAQLERLHAFTRARYDNVNYLWNRMKEVGLERFFIFPESSETAVPSWFGFPLTIRTLEGTNNPVMIREELMRFLSDKKIGTRLLFASNYMKQPVFHDVFNSGMLEAFRVVGDLPFTNRIVRDTFWIGCWPGITEEMIEYVISRFLEFTKKEVA